MLFVIIRNLRVDCGCEHVPFGRRKGSVKSGHNFWPFCCDPVVVAVDCFGGVYIVLHYAKISKVSQEKLERSAAIVRVSVEDWSIFSHGGERSEKENGHRLQRQEAFRRLRVPKLLTPCNKLRSRLSLSSFNQGVNPRWLTHMVNN